MPETSVKKQILQAVGELPADVTYEDVMERIYLLQKVERGRQQIAAGRAFHMKKLSAG